MLNFHSCGGKSQLSTKVELVCALSFSLVAINLREMCACLLVQIAKKKGEILMSNNR